MTKHILMQGLFHFMEEAAFGFCNLPQCVLLSQNSVATCVNTKLLDSGVRRGLHHSEPQLVSVHKIQECHSVHPGWQRYL